MDVALGLLPARLERPQTRKFAWPIVILPELFTSSRHLAIMAGHLVSLGWEVYLLDIHPASSRPLPQSYARATAFSALLQKVQDALCQIGSPMVVAGHGLGGLLALKLAEATSVRAAVALAPLIPGWRTPLFRRRRRWMTILRSNATTLPVRRRILELVSDAESFQHESLIKALIPADTSAAIEVADGVVKFNAVQTPRLVIAGEADSFAPLAEAARFAAEINANFINLPGCGHWLIGGRALERTIACMQRFLVRASGEELLLLYEQPDAVGGDQ
jgi:pimeloyl-ACP methyl ester carboxylesterase